MISLPYQLLAGGALAIGALLYVQGLRTEVASLTKDLTLLKDSVTVQADNEKKLKAQIAEQSSSIVALSLDSSQRLKKGADALAAAHSRAVGTHARLDALLASQRPALLSACDNAERILNEAIPTPPPLPTSSLYELQPPRKR